MTFLADSEKMKAWTYTKETFTFFNDGNVIYFNRNFNVSVVFPSMNNNFLFRHGVDGAIRFCPIFENK